MRDASQMTSETSVGKKWRLDLSSLRSRLAGALLLASLPGVILGALEARRSYYAATQQELDDIAQTARQIGGRLEEVVLGARILAESLSNAANVRNVGAGCSDLLASAFEQSGRFGGISRIDRDGRVLCAARSEALGLRFNDEAWFQDAMAQESVTISPSRIGRVINEQIISISAPVSQGQHGGLVLLSLRGQWLIEQAAASRREGVSVVLLDSAGKAFGVAASDIDQANAIAAAESFAASGESGVTGIRAAIDDIEGGGLRVVVLGPESSGAIGFRAALIVAAPLIALGLAITAVWLALNFWVMRWIDVLVHAAHQVSAGKHEPLDLTGAPQEIKILGQAFDEAVVKASERADELSKLLGQNLALTRELHHRVKNNLQIVTSALTRQFRRSKEPAARYALAEARARLLPISLAYRYNTSDRQDITRVDLANYLVELTRQTHATLDGASRGVDLSFQTDDVHVSGETATAVGTILGECLTAVYLSTMGMSNTTLMVTLKADVDGERVLECGVQQVNPSHQTAHMDEALVHQLAGQISGTATIDLGPRLTLTWPIAVAR